MNPDLRVKILAKFIRDIKEKNKKEPWNIKLVEFIWDKKCEKKIYPNWLNNMWCDLLYEMQTNKWTSGEIIGKETESNHNEKKYQ